LRAAIAEALPDILAELIEKARTGDSQKLPNCCWSAPCPPSNPWSCPRLCRWRARH
jgi:hypothetical protein